MKFTCSQMALNKAINTVSKAISSRTTIPILKGILFELSGNVLKLTGSNLELTIETVIDVQNCEEGNLVIDYRLLSEVVRRLPNAMVTAQTDEDGTLNINCLGSSFSLVCFDAEEYPRSSSVEAIRKTQVSKKSFCELIKRTAFAASIDEKKGVLIGCLINFKRDMIEMAALDGYRMSIARYHLEEEGIEAKVVVPAKMLSDISRLIAENESGEMMTVLIDEKKLQFEDGETKVTARLLVGDFIDYNDILPKEWKTRFVVSRADLQGALERASLFAKEGQNNLIKITAADGRVEINSRSEEGKISEQVLCELDGNDITIGFNSKFLLEILKSVDDEEVAFEMVSSVTSTLVKPVEGDSFLFFVLPVRIVAA